MPKLKETHQASIPSWQQVVVFVDEEVWCDPSSHLELSYLCKIGRCKFVHSDVSCKRCTHFKGFSCYPQENTTIKKPALF